MSRVGRGGKSTRRLLRRNRPELCWLGDVLGWFMAGVRIMAYSLVGYGKGVSLVKLFLYS